MEGRKVEQVLRVVEPPDEALGGGGGDARGPADVLGHEGLLPEEVRTPQRTPWTIPSRRRV